MSAADGFLAGLIGGGRPPARDEVEDGVHPAASLCLSGCHQPLCIPILYNRSNRRSGTRVDIQGRYFGMKKISMLGCFAQCPSSANHPLLVTDCLRSLSAMPGVFHTDSPSS